MTPRRSYGPSRSAAAPATASSTTCAPPHVDAFLTADLRHHPASEARAHSPLALLDAAHWATEWPWCELAAAQLDEISDRKGWGLRVHVSKTVTDPWTAHAASTETPNAMGAPN